MSDIKEINYLVAKYSLGASTPEIHAFLRHIRTLLAEVERLNSKTYCAYCGKEYPLDTVTADQIGEHIATCEKHPLHRLQAENAKLLAEVDRLQEEDRKGSYAHKIAVKALADSEKENAELRNAFRKIRSYDLECYDCNKCACAEIAREALKGG